MSLTKVVVTGLIGMNILTYAVFYYRSRTYENKLEALLATDGLSFMIVEKLHTKGKGEDLKIVCREQVMAILKVLRGRATGSIDVQLFVNAVKRESGYPKHNNEKARD